MTPDARRRIELLAGSMTKATSHAIDATKTPVVVRVELAPGERHISMLTDEEHTLLRELLAAGPKTLATRAHGTLTYDPSLRSWAADGTPSVRIFADDRLDAAGVAVMEGAFARALAMDAEVREAIVARLWKLYDGTWRPDEGGAADAASFAKTPTLVGISGDAADPSRITLAFDDHDLFAGHAILVTIANGKVVDAEIAG